MKTVRDILALIQENDSVSAHHQDQVPAVIPHPAEFDKYYNL